MSFEVPYAAKPDDKIEVIFKNMRKYLLDKE